MDQATAYWSPLIKLVRQLDCWARISWKDGETIEQGTWGQLLIMPVDGYLEGPDGPWPLRVVERVEVSTSRVIRMLGRPPQMVDVEKDLVTALQATPLKWEMLASTWSMEGARGVPGFEDEPVHIASFPNPFRLA